MTPPYRVDLRGRGIEAGDMVVLHPSREGPYWIVSLPEHPESTPGHPQGALHLEGLGPLLGVRSQMEIMNR